MSTLGINFFIEVQEESMRVEKEFVKLWMWW